VALLRKALNLKPSPLPGRQQEFDECWRRHFAAFDSNRIKQANKANRGMSNFEITSAVRDSSFDILLF
jgi:hypothetical protein